jgi:hypothetical protein
MPISSNEFRDGKLRDALESEILSFLNERENFAFSSQEIMRGVRYRIDFSTTETAMISAFSIADFVAILFDLFKTRRIDMKIVRGRTYYTARKGLVRKCPKCTVEIEPKKTWKMAGRPDKKGKRLQLHIGLFVCPQHGYFRKVLGKQKI